MTRAGSSYGLTVALFVNQSDYLGTTSPSAGFRVSSLTTIIANMTTIDVIDVIVVIVVIAIDISIIFDIIIIVVIAIDIIIPFDIIIVVIVVIIVIISVIVVVVIIISNVVIIIVSSHFPHHTKFPHLSIQVLLHNPGDVPLMLESAFKISPGFITSVSVALYNVRIHIVQHICTHIVLHICTHIVHLNFSRYIE